MNGGCDKCHNPFFKRGCESVTLAMEKICKSFGGNAVLKSVDFTLGEGEICALLGENGAGKSTLMNVLGGVLQADSGEISIDGEPASFAAPAESLGRGIAFIHQELNLINDLAIYENLFLGREIKRKNGLLDAKAMIKAAREAFERLEIHLDPCVMVRDLDTSYKQIVEIARAMMMKASVIIMDEPTTSLTGTEIERVFAMMKSLKKKGVSFVFISHKLQEVVRICDSYLVLVNGRKAASGAVSEVTTDDLARMMVGHEVRTTALQRQKERGRPVLRLEDFTDGQFFQDISLTVHAGEILGVTGLLGDGRSELFQTVFGVHRPTAGTLYLEEKPVEIHNIRQAIARGIGYVPGNRKENGIIPDMNILENGSVVTWNQFANKLGFLDLRREKTEFERQVRELHIKLEDEDDSVLSLSGGNQQKVVLAKWLTANPRVLIFDNPTQGVDVGAKEEIYDIILKLAEKGTAIIVLSGEAQEVIRLCDRAIVLFHGEISGEVQGESMNEQAIMRLATGSNFNKGDHHG